MNENALHSQLKRIIETEVFIKNQTEQINLATDPDHWIFDFRRILMNGHTANLISDIFYETYQNRYPFQLCALEIAGVPLVTSLMTKFYYRGVEDINAFFIRKSRKKNGLMRMIEGTIAEEKNIILVDDIMNSGNSFWRQIEVLEALGYRVSEVWSIMRFRDLEYYTRFHNRDIKVSSLFTLDDFTDTLGERVQNLTSRPKAAPAMPFTVNWRFQSENPSLSYVVPKSQPILDDEKIYVGSDNQNFWALNQTDGSVAWQYKVGPHIKKKSIFSNPALFKKLVIFGAYDGVLYALNRDTGTVVWKNVEADWIGSSPAIAAELGMVFIGMEFGLIRKRGGILALDAATGTRRWADFSHPAYTHASPHYIQKHQQVAIGSNDGTVRLYDAKTGRQCWTFTTFGGASYDTNDTTGFGSGSIKESLAYDEVRDYLAVGDQDGFLYIIDRQTGHLVHHVKCEYAVMATPTIYEGKVYFSSLDKQVRCLDLDTFELVFTVCPDQTRIFGRPVIINNRLYVGTNAARLHELDPTTGASISYFQTLERITNHVVHNPTTDTYFLPTFANEIYRLERRT